MEAKTIVQPFLPVYNKQSKILILGSFPSVVSRKNQFYYMNPQNRFWKVLESLYHLPFTTFTTLEKTNHLLELNIALYDVIYQCKIQGSSDSSITEAIVADIPSILKDSNISRIFLNGNTAYQLFVKHFPYLQSICIKLPSTSSANAHFNLEKLIQEWKIILQ